MIHHRVFLHPQSPQEAHQERIYWECSCGASGSCPEHIVDTASDKHINYANGDTRVDTNKL